MPDPPAKPAAPRSGDRLGKYRIVRLLGRGATGTVYLGHDDALDRPVALKVLHPRLAADPAARERFVQEARATARARSDHVVTILEVYPYGDEPFLAMEYLQGRPLDQYLREAGRPPVAEAVRIGREVADGLAVVHALGYVHRDIQPRNVWLEAPSGRAKLLDFGTALPRQADGTPADHRADLFGLGAVLYRMVADRPPFPTEPGAGLTSAPPEPVRAVNPDVPEPLAELIHRLLAPGPADRPASAAEVAAQLKQIGRAIRKAAGLGSGKSDTGHGRSSGTVQQPTPSGTERRRGRVSVRRSLIPVCVASLLTTGAALVWVVPTDWPPTAAPSGDPARAARADPPRPPPPRSHPVPDPPSPVVDFPVELLPLFDPAADAIGSTWVPSDGGFLGRNKPKTIYGGAEFPYRPPEEYDLLAEFSHPEGVRQLALRASHAGTSFQWTLGAGWGQQFGFAYLTGRVEYADRPDLVMTPRTGYFARIEVRRNRVAAYLDGRKVSELATDFRDLSPPPHVRFRDPAAVGVVVVGGPTVFHRVAVVEVTGRGEFTRAGPPDADRKAAAWVLAVGGTVDVRAGGQVRTVAPPGSLPTEAWTLLGVNLNRNPRVRAIDLDRLAGTAVRHLSLDNVPVTDDALARLRRLPVLNRLSLRGALVTDAGLVFLGECPALTEVNLTGTRVTADGVAKLRTARPNCRVVWDGPNRK